MSRFRNAISAVILATLVGAIAAPAIADTPQNPMAVFDSRVSEMERKLTEFRTGPASARNSAEFRALLIRVAQMKAFRPNLIRLPRHEQWNCIAYILGFASFSRRPIFVPPGLDS